MLEKVKNIPLDTWIYDVEVFKKFWCVSFINAKTQEIKTFKKGQLIALKNFINTKLRGCFVGGFNNVNYDDYILREILKGANPYKYSEFIVAQRQKPWLWPNINYTTLPFFTFDIMQLLGVGRLSLKKYEAMLGISIKESSVPFDYNEELSDEQIKEVIDYNIHDIKATLYLFIKFIDQFIIKYTLIQDYNLDNRMLSKTMTQITAKIFNANKMLLPEYKTYTYQAPENVKNMYKTQLPEFYWIIKQLESTTFYTKFSDKWEREQVSIQINHAGLLYEFKSGGLHAGQQIIIDKATRIINRDIISNYPHLIKNYNYGSRRAKNMSVKIGKLIDERLKAKAEKNTLKANYLKELIVRPFGAMDYEFSELWDAKQRMSICLTGELLILFLAVYISKVAKILQVNTDGVMYVPNSDEDEAKIAKICKWWEQNALMTLETEEFTRLYQKDVNNYILVNDKDNKIKTKGGMVKYYKEQFHNPLFNTVRGTPNNNITILDRAVVDYFVNGIQPRETIDKATDPALFMFIFDIKGNYTDVFYGDELISKLKTHRIFYTNTGRPVFKAYKLANGEWKKDKVPLSSEKCKIYNDSILNINLSDLDLDLDYYEQLAWERIEQYKANKLQKIKLKTRYVGESVECAFCSKSLLDELTVRKIYELEVCKDCYFKKGSNNGAN